MAKGRPRQGKYKACEVCGAQFWAPPSRSGKATCSLACRDAKKRAAHYNDETEMRRCGRCEQWKPFVEFDTASGPKTGDLQSYCKACALSANRTWAQENPGKRRAAASKSAAKAKSSGRAKSALTPAQRDRKNALRREWARKNPDKVRAWNRTRVHRQRGGGDMPPPEWIDALLCAQDARCPYCDALLSVRFHVDHKVPISKGGTSDRHNLQLTCARCNLRKGARSDEDFRAILRRETGGWLAPRWRHVLDPIREGFGHLLPRIQPTIDGGTA